MAVSTQVALMRAVNVGGRKAVMAELRAWLTALGFQAPRTLLQSGNLVFGSGIGGAELEALLEREALAVLGFATDFIVRSADEWRALMVANPFADMARHDPGHLVVMALRAAPSPEAVASLRASIQGREDVRTVGRELYVTYPDGIGDSRLTTAAIERRLGVRGTARNWNTATRLATML